MSSVQYKDFYSLRLVHTVTKGTRHIHITLTNRTDAAGINIIQTITTQIHKCYDINIKTQIYMII